MRTLRRLQRHLAEMRRPAIFLFGFGLFIGWLTAPEFLRQSERSEAVSVTFQPRAELRKQILNSPVRPLSAPRPSKGVAQPVVASSLIEPSGDDVGADTEELQQLDAWAVATSPRWLRTALSGPELALPRAIFQEERQTALPAPGGFLHGYGGEVLPASFGRGAGAASSASGGQGQKLGGFSLSSAGGNASPATFSPAPEPSAGTGAPPTTAPPNDGPPSSQPSPGDPRGTASGCDPSDLACRLGELLDPVLNVTGELLVKFSSSSTPEEIAQLLSENRAQVVECFPINDFCLIRVPLPDVLGVLDTLVASPAVETVEPNRRRAIAEEANDPLYSGQWALRTIDAPGAWDAMRSTSERGTIAVLDTGFDVQHPDLKSVIVQTINEQSLTPYISSVSGNPQHGTEVAGVAAAPSNLTGITGVNKLWADLILVKIFPDGSMLTSDADIIKGIQLLPGYALIANMSFAGPGDYPLGLCSAISNKANVLFVAAAGNHASINPEYPAACSAANLISVAATNELDGLTADSNRGPLVHLGAPGQDILTTAAGSSYTVASGTSLAAPHVSGVASMLLAKGRTIVEARGRILSTTDHMLLNTLTGGRLNACRALGGTLCFP